MSDFQVSSQFAHQLQDGEYYDDLLDLDGFDFDQVNTDLVDGESLENPAPLASQDDDGLAEEPKVDEELQRLLSGVEAAPPFDGDQLFEELEPESAPQEGTPANGTLGGSQANEGVLNQEQQNQPQTQSDDFEFDVFGSKEWDDFARDPTNADLVDMLGIGAEKEQPNVDQGYESASQGPMPGTPHPVSNAVGHTNSSNVPLDSYAMNLSASQLTGSNQASVSHQDSNEETVESEVLPQVTFETYEEDDQSINAENPQKGWGRIGKRHGQEVWFNPETSKWQPSASHHSMRATLIARAQAEYPNDKYLHPDPTDGLPHGETAFFKPHQNRGPDREQCADELFVWREYKSKKDEDGKPLRRGKPKYTIRDHPGFMYEGNKILLDPHNNPVVNHDHIPLTLSVHTDGGKLQEMALRPGCRQLDLWARMPRWEKKKGKNGKSEIISLRDKNTRINMPMTRFRERKGTIAGGDREGTDTIMEGLAAFYRHHGFDPVAAGNSVKAFPRDLLPWEVKEVRLGNTARFGVRAGYRALDEGKREDNFQKTLQAIENGKKKQAAKGERLTRKRGHEDEATDTQGSNDGSHKRHCRGRQVDSGLVAWDSGYMGQQGASKFQNSQTGYDVQGNSLPQQGRVFPSPYQRQNPQSQSIPIQNSSNPDQVPSRIGTSAAPAQKRVMHRQAAMYPNENIKVHAALQDNMTNSKQGPRVQYSQSNNGTLRAPTLGQGPWGTSRRSIQQGPPGTHPQQGHFESAKNPPKQTGNTLGPGGRRVQQVPEQVLGKRRQQVADELEESEDWFVGTQQRPVQGSAVPAYGSSPIHKRRRIDGTPSEESQQQQQQQRRRHVERAPRPQYYGAVGAPRPLIPPDDFDFEIPGFNIGAGGRFKPPEELFRELGNAFGDVEPTPTTNEGRIYGTGHTPTPQSEYTPRAPRGHEPQQVLGRRRREEPMDYWDEELYVPQQNPGQRSLAEYPGPREQYSQLPGPKRRRMHGPEG